MTVKLRGVKNVYITGDYIRLDALLKFASIASTGGEAKHIIKNDMVFVCGELCNQRGKKIKIGEIVRYENSTLLVKSYRTSKAGNI